MLNAENFPEFVRAIGDFITPGGKGHAKNGAYRQGIARALKTGQNLLPRLLATHPVPLDNSICASIADEFERDGLGILPRRLAHWPLPRRFDLTWNERLAMWQEECQDAFGRKAISTQVYDAVRGLEPFIHSAGGGGWIVCARSPVPSAVCATVLAPQTVSTNTHDLSLCDDRSGRRSGDAACYEGLLAFRDKRYDEAVAYFKVAADAQHSMALFQLGWLAEEGKGCARDVVAAIGYYERAAALGSIVAHQNLGSIFCVGSDSVTQDMPRAISHFEHGAAAGLSYSMGSLGRILWHATGVEHDGKRAQQLLLDAAKGGDAHALNTLATILDGKYGAEQYAQTFQMYRFAMRLTHVSENALPAYNLANCYLHGKGVKKNVRTARRLFRRPGIRKRDDLVRARCRANASRSDVCAWPTSDEWPRRRDGSGTWGELGLGGCPSGSHGSTRTRCRAVA
jgi:tetratricopeptide (TPR) repeat protein